MQIETRNIPLSLIERNKGQLEGLPKNPRLIRDGKFAKLKQSIIDDPEMLSLRELVVYPIPETDHFIVIGGNMRFAALKELGYTEAPCKIIPSTCPIEKLQRFVIKDNNAYGEWNFDLLANEWSEELLLQCAIDIPVVDITAEEKEPEEDDFNEDNEDIPTICQPGDIWQLGDHRLMCGDSTDEKQVATLMGGG